MPVTPRANMKEIRVPRKAVEEFREIARREWGREMSEDEARTVAERFLADLANGFGRCAAEGDGVPPSEPFVPSAPRTCRLCRSVKKSEPVSDDGLGPLCAACSEALDDGTLPACVLTDRGSWCTARQLCDEFGVTPAKIAALLRRGKLVARTVERTGFRIFVAEDQPKMPEG